MSSDPGNPQHDQSPSSPPPNWPPPNWPAANPDQPPAPSPAPPAGQPSGYPGATQPQTPGGYPQQPDPGQSGYDQQPGYGTQPTYAQQPAYSQQPEYGAQPSFNPASPAAPVKRSGAMIPLAILVGLLTVALVGTGVYWFTQSNSKNTKVKDLKASHQAHVQKRQQDEADLAASFAKADLPGKLQLVKTRNTAVHNRLGAFSASGSKDAAELAKIEVLRNSCLAATVDYNRTAATFSDSIRGSQPAVIDMKDTTMDC